MTLQRRGVGFVEMLPIFFSGFYILLTRLSLQNSVLDLV